MDQATERPPLYMTHSCVRSEPHAGALPCALCKPLSAEVQASLREREEAERMVFVRAANLREMAKVVDEVIAHHRQYNELDEEWLGETARRLRELADSR